MSCVALCDVVSLSNAGSGGCACEQALALNSSNAEATVLEKVMMRSFKKIV
jgi:hypothetical protein